MPYKDPEVAKIKRAVYQKKMKEHRRQLFRERRYDLKQYGLTGDDYRQMLEEQGGKCAICERTAEDDGRSLCVDHDHRTGKIRGLLCLMCNRAIGNLRDAASLARRVAEYLEREGV